MKTLQELEQIRKQTRDKLNDPKNIRITVGMATCGIAAGAKPVLNALIDEVEKRGLKDVSVTQVGCIGMCKHEPIVEVIVAGQEKTTYVRMTEQKAREVIVGHVMYNKPISDYMFK